MFVLTIEGVNHLDRCMWTSHKVLKVAATREELLSGDILADFDDDDIVIVTNVETGEVERPNLKEK